MEVRDALPRDEDWMLDVLDTMGAFDPGFRSYRYVVVEDDGERVGLGRLRERDGETVELTHVYATGSNKGLAKAYAAHQLVRRAVKEGYASILVATSDTKPFESVGFVERVEAESTPVDAESDEFVLRWIPKSQRESNASDETTTHKDDTNTKTDSETRKTGSDVDDSTVAAARRQGIDPDSVKTKYGGDEDESDRTTKYST